MADKIWKLTADGNLGTTGNWTGGTPAAGDNVRFPVGSPAVTTGLTALNTATLSGSLGAVIFEDGASMNVGSVAAPMQITCTRLQGMFTAGQQFFDLQASAIIPRIKAGGGTTGQFGVYLKGSALTSIDILGGYVAIGGLAFETATLTAARVVGQDAVVFFGEGVTLTTLEVIAGFVDLRCAVTTLNMYSPATVTTWGTGAITTVNNYSATFNSNSTGTITTLNAMGGTSDFLQSSAPRTVTTLTPSGTAIVKIDPAYITVTNQGAPTIRYQATYASAG